MNELNALEITLRNELNALETTLSNEIRLISERLKMLEEYISTIESNKKDFRLDILKTEVENSLKKFSNVKSINCSESNNYADVTITVNKGTKADELKDKIKVDFSKNLYEKINYNIQEE